MQKVDHLQQNSGLENENKLGRDLRLPDKTLTRP